MDSYREMVERQERLLQFFEHDESMNSDDSEEDQEEEWLINEGSNDPFYFDYLPALLINE